MEPARLYRSFSGAGAPRLGGLLERLGLAERLVLAVLASFVILLGSAPAFGASAQGDANLEGSPYLRIDPQRIVTTGSDGFTPCGECHTAEWEVWRQTPHATGFDELHRTPAAQDILEQMGLRVTKRQESLCMRCHYTVGPDSTAIAGVSCESCHGPGRDWIDEHNVWGEGITHPDNETPEHRAARIEAAEAGGMLRPSGNVYAVAANCFECHTVPNEELVNRGGHPTGSSNFELVMRTGDIRHNFVHQQWGDESGNREQPQGRKRVLFVVGKLLDYEFALRGLAEASAEGRYSRSMERRAQTAFLELEGLAGVVEVPQVLEALAIERDLVPGNGAELLQVADRVRDLGQDFTASADSVALAPLDSAVEGGFLAVPAAAPVATGPGGDSAPLPGVQGTAASGDGGGSSAVAGGNTPAAAASIDVPGEILGRPSWHASPSQYSLVGEGECGSCHAGAEEWWYDDPHSQAARGLLGDDPKARQIAQVYGIGAAGMVQGGAICMSCHGSVDAASQRILTAGVTCESCHGAGAGYLEPHEEQGNGPQLDLGMRALKDATVRAQNCTRCHLITDERLLASGHPSGQDYDIAAANGSIEHWPGRRPDRGREERGQGAYTAASDADLQAAYASILSGRPIPSVEVVSLPTPAIGGGGGTPSGAGAAGVAPTAVTGRPISVTPANQGTSSRPPVASPVYTPPSGGDGSVVIDLEPLPENPEELTTEELLLLVKQRLETVYGALGRSN